MTLRWLDATTLAIETSSDLVNGAEASFDELSLKLVVNGNKAQATRSSGETVPNALDALGSMDPAVVAQGIAELYERMGDERYWSIVDALWRRNEAAYPRLNWPVLSSTTNRLRIAGLWGQWSREFHRNPAAAKEAASFARSYLAAEDSQVRLEAIGAIGSLGTADDRQVLSRIATGTDREAALRATTAIFAIERIVSVRDSLLPFVSHNAQFEDVKVMATRLIAAGGEKR
jgi:hypothetical protein